MALAVKDPDARIDYGIDWGADYVAGQSIAASSWRVVPIEVGGLAVESASHDLLRTAVRVSGGRRGQVYQLTNHVLLSDGQSEDRSIAIRIDDR